MNFYHFRPACKVIKRSRWSKSPLLSNYTHEAVENILENEQILIHNGKLELQQLGIPYNYSRKVFVGGLPTNIPEAELISIFSSFGSLIVDWPYKEHTNSHAPPKGFAFVIFQENVSVDYLVRGSRRKGDEYFLNISTNENLKRVVQIRPWKLSGIDHFFVPISQINLRLTVFVGGLPRTLSAEDIGVIMSKLFGKVAYVGIDTDSSYSYPKGSARVIFLNKDSVVSAVKKRFVMPKEINDSKMLEIKPFILDDQACDRCKNQNLDGKPTLYCSEPQCFSYLCEFCWIYIHSGSAFPNVHLPMVKQGMDDYVQSLRKRGFL